MGNQTTGSRAPSHLPQSVEQVLQAVARLEESLYQDGFPNLNQTPPVDHAVEHVVQAAAAWGVAVREAYGAGERQERYGGAGVLPLFAASSQFEPNDNPVVDLLGKLPDEYVEVDRFRCDLYFFDYAFSRAGEPHLGQARSLTDPRRRGLAFTTHNWDEIRRRILNGYGRIVKRALGLSNWIRKRIQELESAVVPCIEELGVGSYNRVKVEVSCAGSTRTLELTNMQAEFLRSLSTDGHVIGSRRTKKDVLSSIPELRPWIENLPRDPHADVANEASYGVAPAVQTAIFQR